MVRHRGTNQEVANWFRQGRDGCYSSGMESKDGQLLHWGYIEAIRTKSNVYIQTSRCHVRGWGVYHPSVRENFTLDLETMVETLEIDMREATNIRGYEQGKRGYRHLDLVAFTYKGDRYQVSDIHNREIRAYGTMIRKVTGDKRLSSKMEVHVDLTTYNGWSGKTRYYYTMDEYHTYMKRRKAAHDRAIELRDRAFVPHCKVEDMMKDLNFNLVTHGPSVLDRHMRWSSEGNILEMVEARLGWNQEMRILRDIDNHATNNILTHDNVEILVQDMKTETSGARIYKILIGRSLSEGRNPDGVYLIGRDESNQLWLHRLTPFHITATIESSDRWTMGLESDDKLVAQS